MAKESITNDKDNPNLSLWNRIGPTDPDFVKGFNRGGGFRGTATNAVWLVWKATQVLGPIGVAWGYDILDERYVEGGPLMKDGKVFDGRHLIHVIRLKFWYDYDGKRGEVVHFGQTEFVGVNKHGPFTDEEAPKKSLTDALSKCMSYLGFASDIHLGLWDDNKYVAYAERHHREALKPLVQSAPQGAPQEAPPAVPEPPQAPPAITGPQQPPTGAQEPPQEDVEAEKAAAWGRQFCAALNAAQSRQEINDLKAANKEAVDHATKHNINVANYVRNMVARVMAKYPEAPVG